MSSVLGAELRVSGSISSSGKKNCVLQHSRRCQITMLKEVDPSMGHMGPFLHHSRQMCCDGNTKLLNYWVMLENRSIKWSRRGRDKVFTYLAFAFGYSSLLRCAYMENEMGNGHNARIWAQSYTQWKRTKALSCKSLAYKCPLTVSLRTECFGPFQY